MFNGCTDYPRVTLSGVVGVAVVIALSVLCMSADQSDLPQYSIGPWSALFRLFSVLFAQPHTGVCGDRYIQRSTKFSACVPGKSFSFNMFSVSATRSWFARPSLGGTLDDARLSHVLDAAPMPKRIGSFA